MLLVAPLVAFLVSWLIMRSRKKAALLAIALLVIFYFFGEIKDSLKQSYPGSIWQSYSLLLPLSFALIVALSIYLRKRQPNVEKLFLFLNTVLLLFVSFDAISIAWKELGPKKDQRTIAFQGNTDQFKKPDIYFLIFDSYTSSSFLKDQFHFDNSHIDSSLEKKGFKIIRHSRSNYNLTPFSIGSTFDLEYSLIADTSKDYYLRNYLPGVQDVYENRLIPSLEKLGYEIHNYSIFDMRSHPSSTPPFDTWELNTLFQQHNMLKKLQYDLGYHLPNWLRPGSSSTLHQYARNRDRHDSITLEYVRTTIRQKSEKPKFVYGHLFIPHGPFTFDSAGNKLTPVPNLPPQERMRGYVQQVQHVNKLMLGLVDSLLSDQSDPPVIIIMGDHGHRFNYLGNNDWEFPNFKAFFFPDKNYQLLHDSVTNINTFPIIFNTLFGQQLPMQEDHFYFLKYK